MRRIPALVVAAGLLATLSACAPASNFPAECEVAPSGAASSTVTATGDVGTAPEVSFPTPLIASSIQSTQLTRGDGAPIGDGDPVLLQATIVNGTDGSVLQQTSYDGGGSLFTVGLPDLPELSDALRCSTVGSRVVAVGPPSAGATGATAGASVVYVVDVLDRYLPRADGTDQLPRNGLPAVVTAPDGTPGITVPGESAPTDFEKAVVKLGDGAKVADDSTVVVKYTAVDWDAKTVTDSTWLDGSATALRMDGTDIIVGLREALQGERVGSQIIAVLPPTVAGTDAAPSTSQSTLVYVVDILGIVSS